MKILSGILDKVIKQTDLLLMSVLLTVFFCLTNSYDTSCDYMIHKFNYTKTTGVITGTYSRGSHKNAQFYIDAEYEWNGEIRRLTKAKRGWMEHKGKEITLYVKNSSGTAVRGIVINFMDIVYVLLMSAIIYNWVSRSKRNADES